MIETLSKYILNFLHPIETQEVFRKTREIEKARPLMDAAFSQERESIINDRELTIEEVISVSWLFVLIRAFYVLITVNLGLLYFNENADSTGFISSFFSGPIFQTQKIILFSIIAEIVLFPLAVIIYTKFWENIIKFFAKLYGHDDDISKIANQITLGAVSSNTFLIIPIFGETLRHLAGLFYLFVGLKKNLNMSSLQSFIVLASPIILIMMLFSIFLFGLFVLISSISLTML